MRLLHTMLRVGNLQHSIDFYTKTLEMRLLRTSENPEYKTTRWRSSAIATKAKGRSSS